MAFPPIRHDRVCFDVKKVCGLQATLNPSRKQEAGACESSLAKKKNQLWRRKDLGRPREARQATTEVRFSIAGPLGWTEGFYSLGPEI